MFLQYQFELSKINAGFLGMETLVRRLWMKLFKRISGMVGGVGMVLLTGLSGCTTSSQSSVSGQVLRVSNGAEIETMDPHLATGVPEHRVLTACYEGLMRYDGKTGLAVSGMAERHEMSSDGLTYTFHLRHTAKWSNGEPVTAQDFEFSMKRIVDPKTASQFVHMLFPIKNAQAVNKGQKLLAELGVKALDERTLKVELERPTAYFLQLLPHYTYAPVNKKLVETKGADWIKPENLLCNGPFQLSEVALQEKRVFKKNLHYWDVQNVHLDSLIFYPTDNLNTMTRKFQNGEVDWSVDIPVTEITGYLGKPETKVAPILATYYYLIHTQKPPFNDVRVRQALAMSLNRKTLTEQVTQAGQVPAYSFVPPGTASYGTFSPLVEENPEKAKELLKQAGFGSGGKPFPDVDLLYNTHDDHKRLALAIGQMWKNTLGVHVKPFNKEWKIYIEDKRIGNFNIIRAGWVGDYNDPTTFLEMWTTESEFNEAKWSNKEYDDLMARARQELDVQKRAGLLRKAEEILMKEVPIIPIYFYVSKHLVNPKLVGWFNNLMDVHPYYGLKLTR
jgi:oligopeptide transport system substrate-binding protein